MVFVDTKQIVYGEADSNYTRFHLETGEQYMVSKTLGDVHDLPETRAFVRVHRQYMVNLDHIQKLVKGERTYLRLTNGVSSGGPSAEGPAPGTVWVGINTQYGSADILLLHRIRWR